MDIAFPSKRMNLSPTTAATGFNNNGPWVQGQGAGIHCLLVDQEVLGRSFHCGSAWPVGVAALGGQLSSPLGITAPQISAREVT